MRYLRDTDYLPKITQYDFETITESSEAFIADAELKAQAEIELYLRKRYDLNSIFQTYPDYVSGITYSTGITVWYSTGSTLALYTPNVSTDTIPTVTSTWSQSDPRPHLIVDFLTTVSLYRLHQRLSPDNVPTHRKDAYAMAISQLKMIQSEKVSIDLPEVEDRSFVTYVTGTVSQDQNGFLW
jgi:hypothetical protein